MVDMKLSQQQKTETETALAADDAPEYPWGLRLNLGKEEIAKLSIDSAELGQEVTFTAVAKVTSMSQSASEEGGDHQDLSLQITDMEITEGASKPKSASDKLYGE